MATTAVKAAERHDQRAWIDGKKANQEDVFLERNGTKWFEREVEGI